MWLSKQVNIQVGFVLFLFLLLCYISVYSVIQMYWYSFICLGEMFETESYSFTCLGEMLETESYIPSFKCFGIALFV